MRSTALAAALAAALIGGCGSETPPPTPPAAVYSIRGEIDSRPAADQAQEWIGVHHEAIPDFIGLLGEPEPMESMTMQFTLAEGVELGSLDVGDKIAFELEVDWGAGDPARVIAIEPLPPDTELDLGGGH